MKKWIWASVSLTVLALAGNAYAVDTGWVVTAVPEIDASGAVTALSLLSGFVALAAERLRRK